MLKQFYIIEEFDRERIQEMSNLIADPKNLNIYMRSKSFEKDCTREDKWYKTKYSRESFSEDLLKIITAPNV